MKILQIGLGNNPGGVESFVMNYYRELVRYGIQFDFLCMYDSIAYEEEIKNLGGKIFYVPNVKKNYFGYVKEVRQLLKKEHYDVVHVNMLSAANIVPLRLAHESGIKKIIAHSHNSSAPGLIRNIMDRCNRSKMNKYATEKAACSRKAGEWLFGRQTFEEGKVTVIQNAVNVENYLFSERNRERLRTELGWKGKFVIGHVGRFEYQKNHEALIEIFRNIVKKEPNAMLCLIGEGVLYSHIVEKVSGYGLKDNVFFAGTRKNVDEFLSAMDVFLFPSYFEGLPFTLVEAQANGLPCVISDTITEEIVFSEENVRRLPLEICYEKWAEDVLSFKNWQRTNSDLIKTNLKKKHYDIVTEAERLRRLYQE